MVVPPQCKNLTLMWHGPWQLLAFDECFWNGVSCSGLNWGVLRHYEDASVAQVNKKEAFVNFKDIVIPSLTMISHLWQSNRCTAPNCRNRVAILSKN